MCYWRHLRPARLRDRGLHRRPLRASGAALPPELTSAPARRSILIRAIVNDANVGDTPLGTLADGDQVVVYGTHVYDGFHEGWHELHPLMAIMRVPPPEVWTNIPGLNTEKPTFNPPYLEWDPNWSIAANGTPPVGLTITDASAVSRARRSSKRQLPISPALARQ